MEEARWHLIRPFLVCDGKGELSYWCDAHSAAKEVDQYGGWYWRAYNFEGGWAKVTKSELDRVYARDRSP